MHPTTTFGVFEPETGTDRGHADRSSQPRTHADQTDRGTGSIETVVSTRWTWWSPLVGDRPAPQAESTRVPAKHSRVAARGALTALIFADPTAGFMQYPPAPISPGQLIQIDGSAHTQQPGSGKAAETPAFTTEGHSRRPLSVALDTAAAGPKPRRWRGRVRHRGVAAVPMLGRVRRVHRGWHVPRGSSSPNACAYAARTHAFTAGSTVVAASSTCRGSSPSGQRYTRSQPASA